MTFSQHCVTWLDHKKIDKNNKTLVDLRAKCVNQPDTSQETKRQNMKGTSASHIATGQVNIATIKGGLVKKNIV